jgi:hypothetical protein
MEWWEARGSQAGIRWLPYSAMVGWIASIMGPWRGLSSRKTRTSTYLNFLYKPGSKTLNRCFSSVDDFPSVSDWSWFPSRIINCTTCTCITVLICTRAQACRFVKAWVRKSHCSKHFDFCVPLCQKHPFISKTDIFWIEKLKFLAFYLKDALRVTTWTTESGLRVRGYM